MEQAQAYNLILTGPRYVSHMTCLIRTHRIKDKYVPGTLHVVLAPSPLEKRICNIHTLTYCAHEQQASRKATCIHPAQTTSATSCSTLSGPDCRMRSAHRLYARQAGRKWVRQAAGNHGQHRQYHASCSSETPSPGAARADGRKRACQHGRLATLTKQTGAEQTECALRGRHIT